MEGGNAERIRTDTTRGGIRGGNMSGWKCSIFEHTLKSIYYVIFFVCVCVCVCTLISNIEIRTYWTDKYGFGTNQQGNNGMLMIDFFPTGMSSTPTAPTSPRTSSATSSPTCTSPTRTRSPSSVSVPSTVVVRALDSLSSTTPRRP